VTTTRRYLALSVALVGAMTLASCSDGDTSDARRRNATATGSSSVATVPTPPTTTATTTLAGEPTSRVAYIWDRDVCVADQRTGANVRVTADRHLGAETAVWMHGADHVTFASTVEVPGANFDLASTIWDVDLLTGIRTPLYRTDASVMDFDWAHDGRTLAILETNRSSEHVVRVGIPQAGEMTPIFTVAPRTPVAASDGAVSLAALLYGDVSSTRRFYDQRIEWSPDGVHLLFVDPVLSFGAERPQPSLFVLDPSGTLIASRAADGAAWVTPSSIVVSVTAWPRGGSMPSTC
jgi:dipeptidyl aminopeptidase/acylaminoacyl peptidase